MPQALANFRELWERTSLIQRVILLGIVLACVGASALLLGWARQPHMVPLYAGLDPEDAAKIVEKIRDEGVPYEVTAGGTAVSVPADQVYTLKLSLAGSGLPAGRAQGYRILDEGKIGTSPFKERVNYIRAIEGELAKTIELLDGVQRVRVHIVRPESPLFAGQQDNSSATVALRLRPGWRLTPTNIASVVHLVAGSVEGLTPEKVVVVDSTGQLLSGEGGDALATKAGTFLDYKSRVEEYLAGKAEDMLVAALGPNRAAVRVDAVIDTSQVTETTETFDPDNRVVTKEEMLSKSSAPLAGGEGAPPPTGSKTQEENIVNEYLVSRVVQEKSDLPGKVVSLTVAAFVDLTPAEVAEGVTPPPALTVQDVEDIIRNAIGLKTTDTLKVAQTAFPQRAVETMGVEEEASLFTSPQFLLEMARRVSLGVLVIGGLLMLKMFRGKAKKVAAEGAGASLALEAQGAAVGLLPGTSPAANPELLRAQITHALQENPEEVKRLFLRWIESEKAGA